MTLFLLLLACLGLIFGSFASMLIYRIYNKKTGIVTGRSACTKCNTTLGVADLIPVFSYLLNKWACRHCGTKISCIYPLIELTMATMFVLTGYILIDIPTLIAWEPFYILYSSTLFISIFSLVTISFYDLLYMEIPDVISIPLIYILILCLLLSTYIPDINAFFYFQDTYSPIINGLLGAGIIYAFFYIQVIIPTTIQAIRKKKYADIWKVWGYGIIILTWIVARFVFPKKYQEEQADSEELASWIGFWDLRIALIMGLLGGLKIGLLGLFLGYLLGAICGSIILVFASKKQRKHIPFWPFLSLGIILSIMFYEPIIHWYFLY